MMSYIKRTAQVLSVLTLLLVVPLMGKTPGEVQFHILPQSNLTLEGNSTLHKFSLQAEELNGSLVINKQDYRQNPLQAVTEDPQGQVKVPVKQLNSGEKGLDKNMEKAMAADQYPEITYHLTGVALVDTTASDTGWTTFRTTGDLTIHGTTKSIAMTVKGQQVNENQLRFKGKKPIKMSDYGVKPPVLMFGAIKTDDTIVVDFNLLVKANQPLAVLTQPVQNEEHNFALK